MGLILSRPEEAGTTCGPPLRTPLSDVSGPLMHWDMGPCAQFELDYLDCMEAYGHIKGKNKCMLYWQDFLECAQKRKQLLRVEAMKNERDKQFVKGTLGLGPKVKMWAPAPPNDSYSPDPLETY